MRLVGITAADLATHTIYSPKGCSSCSGTGFRGRKAIFEMMLMNSTLREMAFNRAAISEIRKEAVSSGMRGLLGDGRIKILNGTTTLEEVARVAQVAGIVDEEKT
jgi:type II secretory ATPase GspE/PulE/Tfp pilus assembly ATPase PilB-like protein